MEVRESLHLVARFLDVATARRLSPSEQVEVSGWLAGSEENRLFWDQPVADQRHGLGAARFVAGKAPYRVGLIRAALLHDIGKRPARLGLFGRSAASLVRMAGRPGRGRIGSYLRHGQIAADQLELAGAEVLVVSFARHHHGRRPELISEADWELLRNADRVRR